LNRKPNDFFGAPHYYVVPFIFFVCVVKINFKQERNVLICT